jgi:hypothetical protein
MYHVFLREVHGVLGIYHDDLKDSEFRELTKDGIPQGWKAEHFDNHENIDNNDRKNELSRLGTICGEEYSEEHVEFPVGGELSGPAADVRKSFASAMQMDAVFAYLDLISPEGMPTNHTDYIKPIVATVKEKFGDVDGVFFIVHEWAKRRPGFFPINAFSATEEQWDAFEAANAAYVHNA